MRLLDFLLIGAQKSGTTSVYRHLAACPGIYLPLAKETEFFTDDSKYRKGLQWYLDEYFSKAPVNSKMGEASTHYMMYPEAPKRIARCLPEVKLIALLRNPVDRAYSHYRMSIMRGRESRPFEEIVAAAIEGRLNQGEVDPDHDYVEFGRYGRILSRYLDWFPRERMHIEFTDCLDREPQLVMANISAFIGVEGTWDPVKLGKRYNVGGRRRVPGMERWVRRAATAVRRNRLTRGLMSRDRFEGIKLWSYTEFNMKPEVRTGPEPELRAALADCFVQDVAILEERLGARVPWTEFLYRQ